MFALDKLSDNKILMYSAGAVALIAALLLIVVIIRLLYKRGLNMPGGGRARQPRLGIVDAFDLDRQRQLVLVRRDNVEHLVMIGGPNDVLIESQIIRADARPRETTVSPVAAAPLPWPGNTAAEPKLASDDVPVAAREDLRPPVIAAVPPLASEPAFAPVPAGLAPRPVPPAPPVPGAVPAAAPGLAPLPPLPPLGAPPLGAPPLGAPPVGAPLGAPSVGVPPVGAPPLNVPPLNVPPLTPGTPPAPPKRPSFMPPRRPLATPTFGPKPATPPAPAEPGPGPAVEVQRDEPTVFVPETAEIPLAPSPSVAVPPVAAPPAAAPLRQPNQAPSFLRQRSAFGAGPKPAAPPPPPPIPAAVPPIVEPVVPPPQVSVAAPEPEEPVQPKLTEPAPPAPEKPKEPEPLKQDALDTLEEEMAKLLGRNLDKP